MDIETFALQHIASFLFDGVDYEGLHRLLDNEKFFFACRRNIELTNNYIYAIKLAWQAAVNQGAKSIAKQFRYLLLLISLKDSTAQISTEVLEAFLAYGVWTPRKVYLIADLLAKEQKVRTMARLACSMEDGKERDACCDYILDAIIDYTSRNLSENWYMPFLKAYPTQAVKLMLCQLFKEASFNDKTWHDSDPDKLYRTVLERFLPLLSKVIPETALGPAFQAALQVVRSYAYTMDRIDFYCRIIIATSRQEEKEGLIQEALDAVALLMDDESRTEALTWIISQAEVNPLLIPKILESIASISRQRERGKALIAFAGTLHLAPEMVSTTWLAARKILDPLPRARVLMSLYVYVPMEDRTRMLHQIKLAIAEIPDQKAWRSALLEGEGAHEELIHDLADFLLDTNIPVFEIACRSKREDILLSALQQISPPSKGFLKTLDHAWETLIPTFPNNKQLWEMVDRYIAFFDDQEVREGYVRDALQSGVRWVDDGIEKLQTLLKLLEIKFELLVLAATYHPIDGKNRYINECGSTFQELLTLVQTTDKTLIRSVSLGKALVSYIELVSKENFTNVREYVLKPGYRFKDGIVAIIKRAFRENWSVHINAIYDTVISISDKSFFEAIMIEILPLLSAQQQTEMLQHYETAFISIQDECSFLDMLASCINAYNIQIDEKSKLMAICNSIEKSSRELEYLDAAIKISPFLDHSSPIIRDTFLHLVEMTTRPPMRTLEGRTADAFDEGRALTALMPFVPDGLLATTISRIKGDILARSLDIVLPQSIFVLVIRRVLWDLKHEKLANQYWEHVQKATLSKSGNMDAVHLAINEIYELDLATNSELIYWLAKKWPKWKDVATYLDLIETSNEGGPALSDEIEHQLGSPETYHSSIDELITMLLSLLSQDQKEIILRGILAINENEAKAESRLHYLAQLYPIVPPAYHLDFLDRFHREFQMALSEIQYGRAVTDYYSTLQFKKKPSVSLLEHISEIMSVLEREPVLWEKVYKDVCEKIQRDGKREAVSLLLPPFLRSLQGQTKKSEAFNMLKQQARHWDDFETLAEIVVSIWNSGERERLANETLDVLRAMIREEMPEAADASKLNDLVIDKIPLQLVPCLESSSRETYARSILQRQSERYPFSRSKNIAAIIQAWKSSKDLIDLLFDAVQFIVIEKPKPWALSTNDEIHDSLAALGKIWSSGDTDWAYNLWQNHLKGFENHPRWYILDPCSKLFVPAIIHLGGEESIEETIDILLRIHEWFP